MRYRTLIKWHSQACLMLDCHESHRLYHVEPLSISPQLYQRERRRSHEAPENCTYSSSFNQLEVEQLTLRLCESGPKTIGSSQERDAYKSPRGEAGAPAPAPTSPLKRLIVPVDKQFKILGFNLLNTYSKCSGNFVAAVS
jgi:hypothetical protein